MPDVVVRGGEVVDSTGTRRADVALCGELIRGVGDVAVPAGARVLDASGCVVAPALVDLHCHLREPGGEEAETVETGARAAALGGYSAVIAMPNTEPPIDTAAIARDVIALGRPAAVEVFVAGAVTVGRGGERLAPLAEMAGAGVKLFTDDGRGVQDPLMMRHAMEYAAPLGIPIADHCEDEALAAGGQMNEGEWSSRLGLPGSPAAAEELMAFRDIVLSHLTGARLHLMHLSTAGSVELVRWARARGGAVTAEVTPHHLVLTDAEVAGYDPVLKVNPPLRSPTDVAALREGLAGGVFDAVATDHAPHPSETKEASFPSAPPGMLGLETALAVLHDELVLGGHMALGELLALMSWRPAAAAGLSRLHGGPVVEGAPANLCVFDPSARWTVDPRALASRSSNTPFAGRILSGRIRHTIVAGEVVVVDGEACR